MVDQKTQKELLIKAFNWIEERKHAVAPGHKPGDISEGYDMEDPRMKMLGIGIDVNVTDVQKVGGVYSEVMINGANEYARELLEQGKDEDEVSMPKFIAEVAASAHTDFFLAGMKYQQLLNEAENEKDRPE